MNGEEIKSRQEFKEFEELKSKLLNLAIFTSDCNKAYICGSLQAIIDYLNNNLKQKK